MTYFWWKKWFQLQTKDFLTIQGELKKVSSQQFEHPVRVVGAGRTYAGVHAFISM
jgi:tRNA U38,U39,U40 pseudouridine synthase TruA